jgi:DNA-binding IclR family transcriptional regulator
VVLSLRELTKASGIPLSTLARLRQAGVIAPDRKGRYQIATTIQTLLRHYRQRERWAFIMLRRYRIFDERVDMLELSRDR